MARRSIFLETAFWDYFSESSHIEPYAEGCNPEENIKKLSIWYRLFQFICRSSVKIDSPLYALAEKAKNDPMLQKLLKYNGDGKMDLQSNGDTFPILEPNDIFKNSEHYSSLFFTFADKRKAAKKHGVINICKENLWSQNNKFIDSGEAIKTNDPWAWNRINIFNENSNCMIIIDNFILSPNKKGNIYIRQDLQQILRQILPDSLTENEEYVISIFYFDNSSDSKTRNQRKDDYHKLLDEYLRKEKAQLTFKLELFPTATNSINYHKDFHDRSIITNNIWVGSEAGFDLLTRDASISSKFKTKAIKSTKTHCLYLGFGNDVAKWLENAYDHLITEAKGCLKKYKYSTDNRLLQ